MKSIILYIIFLLAPFLLASSEDDIDFENIFQGKSITNFPSSEHVSSDDFRPFDRSEESTQSHEDISLADEGNVDPSSINSNQSKKSPSDSSSWNNETSESSSTLSSNSSSLSISSVKKLESITEIFNNETSSGEGEYSSSESSAMADGRTKSGRKSTIFFVTSSSEPDELSTSSDEEKEAVVLGTRQNVLPLPKTVLQKTMEWMGDAYTLSIVMPIAAGVVFASTIIVFIATCRCISRRCRRRRLRRKALPDSAKKLRPSDHARLLAESTDEEF